MSDQTGSIRRLRGRRVDATVALAAVVPLVVVGAVALTRPSPPTMPSAAPTTATLHSGQVVCPSAAPGDDSVRATLASGGTATVIRATTGASAPLTLAAGVPTATHGGSGPQIISAEGPGAADLAAGRWSTKPLAAAGCTAPVTGAWFAGLGAGPFHDSVIELTNPLNGDAVVDIDMLSAHGIVPAEMMRGISVPAHGTVSFDLLHTIPRLGVLAMHATVVRGQVAVTVHDHGRLLNGTSGVDDWLAGQRTPQRHNLLLGLVRPQGNHQLVIANPGDDQVTATLKLITSDSVLAPAGAPTFQVPPASIVTFDPGKLLHSPVAQGSIGIEVDGTGPLVTSLRRTTGVDLAAVGAGPLVSGATTAVVPPGTKTLLVAGATRAGALSVETFDEQGRSLGTDRLSLTPDQGGSLDLPDGAVVVRARATGASYIGSVVIDTKAGTTVVPLRPTRRQVLVPAVFPGLR